MSHLSPSASAPPCLLLFIKGPLKEGWGLLLLPFGALFWAFCLWDFLLGFLLWEAFAFEYWEEAFTLGLLVWEAFGREKNY
jgi:hypothetical protein